MPSSRKPAREKEREREGELGSLLKHSLELGGKGITCFRHALSFSPVPLLASEKKVREDGSHDKVVESYIRSCMILSYDFFSTLAGDQVSPSLGPYALPCAACQRERRPGANFLPSSYVHACNVQRRLKEGRTDGDGGRNSFRFSLLPSSSG